MEKKEKKKGVWAISVPQHIIDDLKTRKMMISKVLKTSLIMASLRPVYLYSVTCSRDDSIYYCIVDELSEYLVTREMMREDYFLNGSKVYGFGEYDISLIGAFNKRSDAKLFYELLINRALDKGYYIINKYGYRRYVSIEVSIPRLKKLFKSSENLSSLITYIIRLLEESNGSELGDKINNSINRIRKRIRN